MKMKMKMMKIKMKMMKMKIMKIKVKMSMMMVKKVSHNDGYFVMKVILWWNLSRDESNIVMKVMIVKELMTGDVSPVAMFSFHVWDRGSREAKLAGNDGSVQRDNVKCCDIGFLETLFVMWMQALIKMLCFSEDHNVSLILNVISDQFYPLKFIWFWVSLRRYGKKRSVLGILPLRGGGPLFPKVNVRIVTKY